MRAGLGRSPCRDASSRFSEGRLLGQQYSGALGPAPSEPTQGQAKGNRRASGVTGAGGEKPSAANHDGP